MILKRFDIIGIRHEVIHADNKYIYREMGMGGTKHYLSLDYPDRESAERMYTATLAAACHDGLNPVEDTSIGKEWN